MFMNKEIVSDELKKLENEVCKYVNPTQAKRVIAKILILLQETVYKCWLTKKHNVYIQISKDKFKNVFRQCCISYITIKNILFNLGWFQQQKINNNPEYIWDDSNGSQKCCKSYRVLKLGKDVLSGINVKEYYNNVFNVKKRNAIKKYTYDNSFLKETYSFNKSIQINDKKLLIENIINQDEKLSIIYILENIEILTEKELKYNKSDGRVWNVFTSLPSYIKQQIIISGLPYIACLDCRASMPSFFALRIKNIILNGVESSSLYDDDSPVVFCGLPSPVVKMISNDENKLNNKIGADLLVKNIEYKNTNTSTNSSLPISGGGILASNDYIAFENIINEVKRWNSIWFNPDIDGRETISIQMKQTTYNKDKMKLLVNSYLNGCGWKKNNDNKWIFNHTDKLYKSFDNWLKSSFPLLYNKWLETNITKTGCEIAKQYESVLFQNPEVYKLAKENNMILGYINDGFGIYSLKPIEECLANINKLKELLVKQSYELWGVTVILKIKDVKNNITLDNIESYSDDEKFNSLPFKIFVKNYKKNEDELKSLRNECFTEKMSWKDYYKFKAELHKSLGKYMFLTKYVKKWKLKQHKKINPAKQKTIEDFITN